MKSTAIKLTAAVVCIGTGVILGSLWASEAEGSSTPGSVEDPVVTKSYVDQAIAKAVGSGGGGNVPAPPTAPPAAAASTFKIVTVPIGKAIVAAQEGTEFIVRSGRALAHSADKDGVSDLTAGADLTNGKKIAKNHLILSPRPGRGVAPDPLVKGNKLIVMVRGEYKLQ
ncbi:hypothetical protein EBB07_06545 [Paenibacillaceae bacterium]|nr:hypothetical protein EBB07_06545 [Paenibacillaceae bacterium]